MSSTLLFPGLDAAISKAEGFGTPGAIPTLANNPGDLIVSPFSTSHGATGSMTAAGGQKIATFPSVDTGNAAMDALISNNYSSGNITDLSTGWLSGSAPSTQQSWAQTLSQMLGVPVSTPVSQLAGVAPSPSPSTASGAPAGGLGTPLPGGFGSTTTGTPPSNLSQLSPGWAGVQKLADNLDTFFGTSISWSRIAAFVLGLIVIAAGLFLLKPASNPFVGPSLGRQISKIPGKIGHRGGKLAEATEAVAAV